MAREKGYCYTEESKAKMRSAKLGRPLSDAHKTAISAGRKKWLSELTPEQSAALPKPGCGNKGQKHSEEAKAKMRAAKLGKKLSEAHKAAITGTATENAKAKTIASETYRSLRKAEIQAIWNAIQKQKARAGGGREG